jgi:archaellum component FlaC
VNDERQKTNDRHKALPRAKEQIQIYEKTVRRQAERIEELEKKNKRLEKENEKLKQELA